MAERVQNDLGDAANDAKASRSEVPSTETTKVAQRDFVAQTASDDQESASERSNECFVVLLNPENVRRGQPGPITSVEQRNQIAHSNPTFVKDVITGVLTCRASQQGCCQTADGLACWGPSFIPFHLSFVLSCEKIYCRHFVSGKDHKIKKPLEYAKELLPLAKEYLRQPLGYTSSHLPFARVMPNGTDVSDDHERRNEQTQRTVEHARWVISEYGSMSNVSIRTAEATAQLVNRGEILPGLLKHLTLPTTRRDVDLIPSEGPVASADKSENSSLVAADRKKRNKKKKKKSKKNSDLPELSAGSLPAHAQHVPCQGDPLPEDGRLKVKDQPSHHKHDAIPSPSHSVNEGCTKEELSQTEHSGTPVSEIVEGTLLTDSGSGSKLFHPKPVLKSEVNHAGHRIPNQQHTNLETIQEEDSSLFDSTGPEVMMSQEPTRDKEVPGKERRAVSSTKHDVDKASTSKSVLNVLAPAFSPGRIHPCIPLQNISKPSTKKPKPTNIHQEAPMEDKNDPESNFRLEDSMSALSVSEHCEVTSATGSEGRDTPTERAKTNHPDPKELTLKENLAPPKPAEQAHNALAEFLAMVDPTTCDELALKMVSDFGSLTPAEVPSMTDFRSNSAGQVIESSTGIPVFGGGGRGLKWTYATGTPVDQELVAEGIWLWAKPATYYQPKPLFYTADGNGTTLAPVLITHGTSGRQEPLVEFDGKTVCITPHKEPWKDVRSSIGHPDFLVPIMLVDYQACEWAGYQLWRHDRDFLVCRKPDCGVRLLDSSGAVLCLGCGPKTKIRYCSMEHQVEHMQEHWQECGHRDLVIQQVIDQSTGPAHFSEMCPAIRERHGFKSFALHRQRLFAMLTRGHYTLFNTISHSPIILYWPKSHKHWEILDDRIERLLNAVLFDRENVKIRDYLFRLLRHILYLTDNLSTSTILALESQFYEEFGRETRPWPTTDHEPPCECEWNEPCTEGQLDGNGYYHLGICESSHGGEKHTWGHDQGMGTIQRQIEQLEDKFWILRAWQQQHPEEKDWRNRAAEEYYDGGSGSMTIKLGPGWIGWGAEEDNICVSDEIGGVWD